MEDKIVWRTEKILVKLVDDGEIVRITDYSDLVYLPVSEVTAFAMEWLGTHGFEVTKKEEQKLKKLISRLQMGALYISPPDFTLSQDECDILLTALGVEERLT